MLNHEMDFGKLFEFRYKTDRICKQRLCFIAKVTKHKSYLSSACVYLLFQLNFKYAGYVFFSYILNKTQTRDMIMLILKKIYIRPLNPCPQKQSKVRTPFRKTRRPNTIIKLHRDRTVSHNHSLDKDFNKYIFFRKEAFFPPHNSPSISICHSKQSI